MNAGARNLRPGLNRCQARQICNLSLIPDCGNDSARFTVQQCDGGIGKHLFRAFRHFRNRRAVLQQPVQLLRLLLFPVRTPRQHSFAVDIQHGKHLLRDINAGQILTDMATACHREKPPMVVKIEIEIIRNELSRAAGGFDYNIVKCFGQQFTGTLFLIFQIIFYGQAFFRILYTADGKIFQNSEMIDADTERINIARILHLKEVPQHSQHADIFMAQPGGADQTRFLNRPGQLGQRIGHMKHPCVRAETAHPAGNSGKHRNIAERPRNASGPDGVADGMENTEPFRNAVIVHHGIKASRRD